jgi:HSP20 family protein
MAVPATPLHPIARREPTFPTIRPTFWEELADMRRHFDEMVPRNFGFTPLSRLFPAEAPIYEPPIDLYETNEGFWALIPVPGYLPEEIDLTVTKDTVWICGERQSLVDEDKVVAHRKDGVLTYDRFNVNFTVPCEIDPNKVNATLANGMLKVELPRIANALPAGVKVPVNPEK